MTGCQSEIRDAVLVLHLSHAPMNTLTVPVMDELKTILERDGPKCRAIVLQSRISGVFSYGVDPKAALSADIEGRKEIFRALGQMVRSFLTQGVPILTVTGGPAMAGGAVLATLGDYTLIHKEDGKICFSEAKVGLPLPNFVQELIRRKGGERSIFQIGVLARNLNATQAIHLGFADAVYSTEDQAQELLTGMLGKILRLPREVLHRTLLDSRQNMIRMLDEFLADSSDFSKFLSDEFLGAGLKALMK